MATNYQKIGENTNTPMYYKYKIKIILNVTKHRAKYSNYDYYIGGGVFGRNHLKFDIDYQRGDNYRIVTYESATFESKFLHKPNSYRNEFCTFYNLSASPQGVTLQDNDWTMVEKSKKNRKINIYSLNKRDKSNTETNPETIVKQIDLNFEDDVTFINYTFKLDTSKYLFHKDSDKYYIGGGSIGNANTYQLTNRSGIYQTTLYLPSNLKSITYTYLKNPKSWNNFRTKENINTTNDFNDRKYTKNGSRDQLIEDVFGSSSSTVVNYNVKFSLKDPNAQPNDTFYLGGGFFGNANSIQLIKNESNGRYEKIIKLPQKFTGKYTYIKNPSNWNDFSGKENIKGQTCASAKHYNDRILKTIEKDLSLFQVFGNCTDDQEPTQDQIESTTKIFLGNKIYGETGGEETSLNIGADNSQNNPITIVTPFSTKNTNFRISLKVKDSSTTFENFKLIFKGNYQGLAISENSSDLFFIYPDHQSEDENNKNTYDITSNNLDKDIFIWVYPKDDNNGIHNFSITTSNNIINFFNDQNTSIGKKIYYQILSGSIDPPKIKIGNTEGGLNVVTRKYTNSNGQITNEKTTNNELKLETNSNLLTSSITPKNIMFRICLNVSYDGPINVFSSFNLTLGSASDTFDKVKIGDDFHNKSVVIYDSTNNESVTPKIEITKNNLNKNIFIWIKPKATTADENLTQFNIQHEYQSFIFYNDNTELGNTIKYEITGIN